MLDRNTTRDPRIRPATTQAEVAPPMPLRGGLAGSWILSVVLVLLAIAAIAGWGWDWGSYWTDGWFGGNRTAATTNEPAFATSAQGTGASGTVGTPGTGAAPARASTP